MNKKRIVVFAVCVAVAACAAGYAIYKEILLRYNDKQITEVQKAAESVSEAEPKENTPVQENIDTFEIPIDFAAVQQQNADIYAWIQIEDTEVNYPILQHPTDDTYYLEHNLDGSTGYPGCLYTELCDSKDFTDFNTVIYGHDMKDGSMFGNLKAYKDAEYLNSHRQIVVYTPESKLTYTIFAAVIYSDKYIPHYYNDAEAAERQAFLDSLSETGNLNSQVLNDIQVNDDSNIITLSTCIGSMPSNRFLVVAVQTDRQAAQ